MDEIKLVCKSTLLEKEIDVWGTAEEPMFRASDVAEWLGLTNTRDMVSRVDEEELRKLNLRSRSGENWFLTEDGLYEVLMQSRKPIAKQFKKGVKNILHDIRTKGGYIATQQNDTPEMIMARALKIADETIKRNEERLKELEQTTHKQAQEIELKDAQLIELDTAVNNMKPKVSYADNILQCKETINVTQIAQDYGMSAKAFNILLRNLKIQHKVGQVWIVYGKYLAKGYVQSETFTYDKSNGTQGVRTFTKWSQRGRLFLYNTLKAHNIIPLIEQSTNNEK